ncbi:MAG: ShlB/FhaC/HecB family hemolysin secretion/activation protein [Cyanobacteria bacterium P01_H01_bin.15]
MRPIDCCLASLLVMGICPVGIAQVPAPVLDTLPRERRFVEPRIVTPRESQLVPEPEPEPQPLPSPAELLPPATSPAVPDIPDVPGTITVERFEVEGSTIFGPEDFAPILEPFTNRPLTFSELLQARTAITELYINAGYITSGAFIPPQTLDEGTVIIQVLEGTLSEIEVVGLERLNNSYVRKRLEIASGPPLNRDRLLDALQLLQLNPLIDSISAELSAGVEPGTNTLTVTVVEANAFGVPILLDNARVPSVGTFRRQVGVRHGNLTGFGDDINISYTNTDGSNALDTSYKIPFNARNGTFRASLSYTNNEVIEPPFDVLDINSESLYFDLSIRQPIILNPQDEVALGLSFGRDSSDIVFLEDRIGFPSLGANRDGETRVWKLGFSQEWTRRGAQQVIAVRSNLVFGLDIFDATQNDNAPDGEYFAWQGQGQYVRLLAPDTLFFVRGGFQVADQALVALEQFTVGGLFTVRGYRQDQLLVDSGLFASAEVLIPVLRIDSIDSVLQIASFVDVGYGANLKGRPDPDPDTLVGIGLGVRWRTGDLTARFDWGIPLIKVDDNDRTLQEDGLYFSLQYSPF